MGGLGVVCGRVRSPARAGAAAAIWFAVGVCGTGVFRVVFFEVRIRLWMGGVRRGGVGAGGKGSLSG